MRYRLDRFSLERLLHFLRALGVNVEITLKDAPARPKDGESYGRPEVVAGVHQNKGPHPTSRPVLRCGERLLAHGPGNGVDALESDEPYPPTVSLLDRSLGEARGR